VHGRRARLGFRGFWAMVGPFTRVIPHEVQAAAIRSAER
jgi:hypothetical protein